MVVFFSAADVNIWINITFIVLLEVFMGGSAGAIYQNLPPAQHREEKEKVWP